MTTTAWAHLPNAAHIDRVLASLEKNPEKWSTARGLTADAAWDGAREAAWDVAGSAAGYEARGAVWDAAHTVAHTVARDEARGAVWDAARAAARGAARGAAWDAILALVAWDDCAYMLELPEDALKVLRAVGNEQAILLSVAANILKETL